MGSVHEIHDICRETVTLSQDHGGYVLALVCIDPCAESPINKLTLTTLVSVCSFTRI